MELALRPRRHRVDRGRGVFVFGASVGQRWGRWNVIRGGADAPCGRARHQRRRPHRLPRVLAQYWKPGGSSARLVTLVRGRQLSTTQPISGGGVMGSMGSGVRAATEVSHRTSRASSATHIQSEALTITASHRGDSAYGQEQGHHQGHHHQPPQHQHGRGDAAGGTGRHHPLAAAAAAAHGGHHAGGGGYMSYQKGIFKMDGQPTGVEVDVAVHVVAQVRPAVARRQAATLTARRRSSETGRPLLPASAPSITAASAFAGAPTVSPQARVESDWDVRNDAVASLGGGGGGFGSIGGSFGGAIDHRAAGGYGGGTDIFRGLTVASCAISADPRRTAAGRGANGAASLRALRGAGVGGRR
mmetsp:Transcript_35243/g.88121  ORF Transcript_35243/g.88121 Transcript_35243/m.88121 type:complete len:358 (+) Transcript_35243:242-1315(+)